MITDDHIRIIVGFSGAGKTAWVSEAAAHTPSPVAYFDVADTPGPALASALARELTARIFGRSHGVVGEILLPGASGLDMLGKLSALLGERGLKATVVIDNAHGLPPNDLHSIVVRTPNVHFIVLCQPAPGIGQLEALLDVKAAVLSGWDEDTIAAVAADAGCVISYADCERLSRLTGGLPFYVIKAATVAAKEYGGSVARFCGDIEDQTHVVATAQEIILRRAFETMPGQGEADLIGFECN